MEGMEPTQARNKTTLGGRLSCVGVKRTHSHNSKRHSSGSSSTRRKNAVERNGHLIWFMWREHHTLWKQQNDGVHGKNSWRQGTDATTEQVKMALMALCQKAEHLLEADRRFFDTQITATAAAAATATAAVKMKRTALTKEETGNAGGSFSMLNRWLLISSRPGRAQSRDDRQNQDRNPHKQHKIQEGTLLHESTIASEGNLQTPLIGQV
jgi:hypothetical protein